MVYFVYPRLRKLSGAERLILRLASYVASCGTPVTLVTHYLDASCAPALSPDVHVIQTGDRLDYFSNHYLNAPFEYLHSLRLSGLVGADAQAVTFFGPPSLPALAWFSVRRPRVQRIYFCYEPPRFIYDDAEEVAQRMGASGMVARPLFWLYKLLDRTMVRRADTLLANSRFGAERLRAAYGRDAAVITHGADLSPAQPEQVQAVRATYALDSRSYVLLTVNFLHPRKRIDLFLRAFADLRARVPQAVALIVGAGPEQDALRLLAHELQVADSVHFAGFVPDEELPAYYAASDVYMHTCKNESFGLSVLEASTTGLPVVAVNEGGPREIIDDAVTGLLVPATPQALANAAHTLALDPARRLRMGAAARQRVAGRYAWTQGADDFLRVMRP